MKELCFHAGSWLEPFSLSIFKAGLHYYYMYVITYFAKTLSFCKEPGKYDFVWSIWRFTNICIDIVRKPSYISAISLYCRVMLSGRFLVGNVPVTYTQLITRVMKFCRSHASSEVVFTYLICWRSINTPANINWIQGLDNQKYFNQCVLSILYLNENLLYWRLNELTCTIFYSILSEI